jgi:hypothetical protein
MTLEDKPGESRAFAFERGWRAADFEAGLGAKVDLSIGNSRGRRK